MGAATLRHQYNFKFHPSLLEALRAHARDEGTTVTALLERGAYHVLGQEVGPRTRRQPAKQARELSARPEPESSPARDATPVAPMDDTPEDPLRDRCARCGHPRFHHWEKGCKAGCPCAARRFVEGKA